MTHEKAKVSLFNLLIEMSSEMLGDFFQNLTPNFCLNPLTIRVCVS